MTSWESFQVGLMVGFALSGALTTTALYFWYGWKWPANRQR